MANYLRQQRWMTWRCKSLAKKNPTFFHKELMQEISWKVVKSSIAYLSSCPTSVNIEIGHNHNLSDHTFGLSECIWFNTRDITRYFSFMLSVKFFEHWIKLFEGVTEHIKLKLSSSCQRTFFIHDLNLKTVLKMRLSCWNILQNTARTVTRFLLKLSQEEGITPGEGLAYVLYVLGTLFLTFMFQQTRYVIWFLGERKYFSRLQRSSVECSERKTVFIAFRYVCLL